jgi:hypothetical protein
VNLGEPVRLLRLATTSSLLARQVQPGLSCISRFRALAYRPRSQPDALLKNHFVVASCGELQRICDAQGVKVEEPSEWWKGDYVGYWEHLSLQWSVIFCLTG